MAPGGSDWEAERASNRYRMRSEPSMTARSRALDVIVVSTIVTVLGGIVFFTGTQSSSIDTITPVYVLTGAILAIVGSYNVLREVIDVPASIGASFFGLIACVVLITSAATADVGGNRILAIGFVLTLLTAYTALRSRPKRIERPERDRRTAPK